MAHAAERMEASFGDRLRRARKRARLTQEELAERAGLSPNAVSALERGERRHPYPATVRALSAALALTPEAAADLAAAVPRRGQAMTKPPTALPELPTPVTPLIGREHEIVAMGDLLGQDQVRLLTLTGPGGVGKTRLAIGAAHTVAATFPDGVHFVSLAAVSDSHRAPEALARALGASDDQEPLVWMVHQLRHHHGLLLLDNFEHVVDAAQTLVDLLQQCPYLTLLVTSRVRLQISGEQEYVVPPLKVQGADLGTARLTPDLPAAIQLFVARAGLAPGRALSPETIATITAICQRVDGLPLAIELAAAWTKILSLPDLLSRLEQRLTLLVGRGRSGAPHQQTMRDTIAWSYDLLAPEEQYLFRRLGVFVGSWTLTAAAEVTTFSDPIDVLPSLRALVDASLVRSHDIAGSARRFSMLETVREYAWEQLAAHGEATMARNALAAWSLAMGEQAAPFWFTPEQGEWADRFDLEQDNLRAALTWSADCGGTATGVALVGRLWPYWFVRGHITEALTWTEAGLRWAEGDQTIERVRVLTAASCFVRTLGDEGRATALGEEACHLAETIGAARGIDAVHALIGVALTAGIRRDTAQATSLNQTILGILRELEEDEPSAPALESVILVNWAALLLDCGDDDRAQQLVETALPHQRRFGFTWGESDSLLILAMIAHARGELTVAAAHCRDSLTLAWTGHDPQQILSGLELLARLAGDAGHLTAAAQMLGAGEQLIEHLGVPRDRGVFSSYDEMMHQVRDVLGEVEYHRARLAGRGQPMAQAIAEALALAQTLATEPGSRDPLTPIVT